MRATRARSGRARADLERALDALLENALRYSPAGSAVTIVGAPGRIEVRDRGPGVTPDERELVFERFRRGSAGLGGPSGHGLGLPIARELAREWGGDVRIEGRDGGGCGRDPRARLRGRADRRRMTKASPIRALPALNHRVTTVRAR